MAVKGRRDGKGVRMDETLRVSGCSMVEILEQ